MTGLSALWLPVVLSSVIVFIASSLVHMVLPWHKGDYPAVPNQDKVADALRPFAIPPGDYMLPRPESQQQMRTPEFLEKMKKGPVMMLTVMPNGMMSMGKNLVQWFVYCVVVGIFAAYIVGHALSAGATYPQVFRLIGATAFAGYVLGQWPASIWFNRSWATTLRFTIDGFIYALLTAGTFGWLWPR